MKKPVEIQEQLKSRKLIHMQHLNDTVKCSHYQIMQCIILRYPNNDDIYQRLSRDVLFLININILYLMILEFNISYMTHS